MDPFQKYLKKLLKDHLEKRMIAVWYDPRSEFIPFLESLPTQGAPENSISRVTFNGMDIYISRFQGSFFEIKAAVESFVAVDKPEPLVLYLPGISRNKTGSVLMELEMGGHCFEWKLKSQARFCLREKFTDGVIDDMLISETITYKDIVGFLAQRGGEKPSVLRMIFDDCRGNTELIACFLADPSRDSKIIEKDAAQELYKLMESRIGLTVAPHTPLDEVRQKALRFLFVNEFRSDLSCEPPACVAMIPETQKKEQSDLACKIAQTMRRKHEDAYVDLSDRVANELDLAVQNIDAKHLGKVDTFRFEEMALLSTAGELIRHGNFDDALRIVTERKRSFWVDRNLTRQTQWKACRLMARLGVCIKTARGNIPKAIDSPKAWVQAYSQEDGLYQVDQAQHAMEAWVAKMEEDPENEAALEMMRQAYEDYLQEMTQGFVEALARNDWSVSEFPKQTEIYSTVVGNEKTPTAYFFVDAMRYAMAVELVKLMSGAKDLILRPAIAAWPTITPVGMAALLPRAESGFCVVKEKGNLAAQVENAVLSNVNKRMKFIKAQVPGTVEMQLEKLLEMSSNKLTKTIAQVPLVVIRSQEIDALGEMAGSLVARQLMDTMVGNVARAVKKLATAGIHRFVITADHGHLFTRKKKDAFKTDHPGGKTLEIHRRCWIGHGGSTPPGTVRLSGSQIGYDTDLEFVFPKGIGVFKTGGDLGYHHGGLSLQEMIIPVLTLKVGKEKAAEDSQGMVQLSDEPGEITNRTFGIQLVLTGLFDLKPLKVKPILLSKGVIVGKAGMAVDADFDQEEGDVELQPQKKASVVMILEKDDVDKCKIVIQDPTTDRVLDQSKDIKVKLGTI